jgi:hypothetical protein
MANARPTEALNDQQLTPRARNLALWLCDLANPALDRANREASADLLLRELPDHWTAGELETIACEHRDRLGSRASHRAWLAAMGWLVRDQERLPPRPSQRLTESSRGAMQHRVRVLLATLTAAPGPQRRRRA